MSDRDVMQQALEALENTSPLGFFNMESDKKFFAAITALRARLAEPEPVAQTCKPALQAARRSLTDDEIDRVIDVNWSINNHKPTYVAHRAFARAIERAHGITGANDE